MNAPKLATDTVAETGPRSPTPTELLSLRAPTGAPAFGVGTNQAELARLVEDEARRILSAAKQSPTELELPTHH